MYVCLMMEAGGLPETAVQMHLTTTCHIGRMTTFIVDNPEDIQFFSVTVVGVLAEILTGHLPNTNVKLCHMSYVGRRKVEWK